MGTATGLTAARMQEIIDQQILAGAVDLSGNLIMTRADGSSFNAGAVKGAKGDPAVYEVPGFPSSGTAYWVRLAVIDGINATQGASIQFLLSGVGGWGTRARETVLVHASQRAAGLVDLSAWSWGADKTPANSVILYTKQTGDYLFEIWGKFAAYTPELTLSLLSSWRGTLTLDNLTAVDPTGLVATTITTVGAMSSQTLPGLIEIATNAEAQAGTDAVRAVTPAGLASIVGVGLGYRFVQRVIFTSSGSFLKASYPGLRAIRVMAVGGGGGGAGAGGASGGMNSYGTGGGSGGYAESFITNIAGLATSVAVTVGAAGAATANGAITGNDGSASSFGTAVVAGGGGGGQTKGNSALGGYVRGGLGGTPTAGDIQQGGTPGQTGMGRDTLAQPGSGGSSIFGGGGLGNASGAGGGSYAGQAGMAYGAGGGGAAVNAGGVAAAGGAGANGVVIVEIYR
ncbi:hypothetical protein SEA_DIZZYRUDY_21 [Microbacterium phage DizzyRudy]|nr:hypothetical protein SEA_DIZZYRUDY_21 [Microbacterium phage DizzyRudy]